jgi:hypothetical protein
VTENLRESLFLAMALGWMVDGREMAEGAERVCNMKSSAVCGAGAVEAKIEGCSGPAEFIYFHFGRASRQPLCESLRRFYLQSMDVKTGRLGCIIFVQYHHSNRYNWLCLEIIHMEVCYHCLWITKR